MLTEISIFVFIYMAATLMMIICFSCVFHVNIIRDRNVGIHILKLQNVVVRVNYSRWPRKVQIVFLLSKLTYFSVNLAHKCEELIGPVDLRPNFKPRINEEDDNCVHF